MVRNFRRSGPRPNRGWSYTNFAAFSTIGAGLKVLLGSFTPSNPGVDLTLLRCIGGLSIASDQAGAVETQLGAFGMVLVTDLALAAGAASIPGPFTDGEDDGWFCHQSFQQEGDASVTSSLPRWYPFDTKGKRIMEGIGISIAIMVENGHATNGLTIAAQVRLLAQVRGTR